MNKNIGGSIFASNNPRILIPLDFKGGKLIVIPDHELDTHRLEFHKSDGIIILASHPNGFSCRNLAERMIGKIDSFPEKKAEYIVRCGGTADLDSIKLILNS